MQEIVYLKMSLKKLSTCQSRRKVLGLTFAKIVLVPSSEVVTTDQLLVSDEAVRVLDTRT